MTVSLISLCLALMIANAVALVKLAAVRRERDIVTRNLMYIARVHTLRQARLREQQAIIDQQDQTIIRQRNLIARWRSATFNRCTTLHNGKRRTA
ncbi:MAG: hypothetical protein U0350_40105 [Caldilineaceae bacterium]